MCDRGTQTPTSPYGAELRVHYCGLSRCMGFLAVALCVLCLLNGCSYYLYWRSTVFATSTSRPAAFHATAAGVFFLFVMTQVLVQRALRSMIQQMSYSDREKRVRLCCLIFAISLLPTTSAQLALYAHGCFSVSKQYAAVFIITEYLNVLGVACTLSYAWTSACAEWLHVGVSRAAREHRAKTRGIWNKHLAYVIATTASVQTPPADGRPGDYTNARL
ncbi:uncharacterized protein TM35_000044080 [Trypanosoma theileri]|uniref:Uncharacterized protein n=1 Tax=Trypanosoma theileri TaxID=67003 RepID=A0A1X0P5G7_9TRYP|nr:uncharacterized protein TM35_000044080 [Trypanosoma theileri]ORC92194.1 hypothetical protein TM35_000044080 [Trypanosoma theileri]